MRKPGGGPPHGDLTALEETVIGIIGNKPIDGIPRGTDICEDDEESSLCKTEIPGPSHEIDFDETATDPCQLDICNGVYILHISPYIDLFENTHQ